MSKEITVSKVDRHSAFLESIRVTFLWHFGFGLAFWIQAGVAGDPQAIEPRRVARRMGDMDSASQFGRTAPQRLPKGPWMAQPGLVGRLHSKTWSAQYAPFGKD